MTSRLICSHGSLVTAAIGAALRTSRHLGPKGVIASFEHLAAALSDDHPIASQRLQRVASVIRDLGAAS